jgi:light-regulated signal transduction histidine kinase (bacteriophytochrome)
MPVQQAVRALLVILAQRAIRDLWATKAQPETWVPQEMPVPLDLRGLMALPVYRVNRDR